MHKCRAAHYAFLFAGLFFCLGADAGSTPGNFHVYRGNSLEYYASRLPDPIVIYVYSSQAKLVGVIDPHGQTNEHALEKVAQAITHHAFEKLPAEKRNAMENSLDAFLSDQGYQISEIVRKDTAYTLVLTMQEVRKTDCQAYADVEERFKGTIERSIDTHGKGAPQYSAVVLEVGSPKSKIICK